MASVVYATPGAPYVTPTDATTGGTLLAGIEEQSISFDPGLETRLRRTGVGASAGYRMRAGRVQPARLIMPLRDQSSAALKILFSQLTTSGTTFRDKGGTAAAEFAKLPTFAIVLRPKSTSEKYLYAPNWALSQESAQLVLHHENGPQLSDAVLVLVATKPSNATGPAWMWDTAANIDTAYGL